MNHGNHSATEADSSIQLESYDAKSKGFRKREGADIPNPNRSRGDTTVPQHLLNSLNVSLESDVASSTRCGV